MACETPIAEAKARFAELVRRAEGGETVVLTRHGRRVAQLKPVEGEGAQLDGTPDPHVGEIREPTEAYPAARRARAESLARGSRRELLERFFEESIWPRIPEDQLGTALDKHERERILGYGSDGV